MYPDSHICTLSLKLFESVHKTPGYVLKWCSPPPPHKCCLFPTPNTVEVQTCVAESTPYCRPFPHLCDRGQYTTVTVSVVLQHRVSHIPLLVALAMTKGEKKQCCLCSWGLGERREEPTENTPSNDEYSGRTKGKTETPYLQELLLSDTLTPIMQFTNMGQMAFCIKRLKPCDFFIL